jgi:membrane-bound lytic murein transglycosylase B
MNLKKNSIKIIVSFLSLSIIISPMYSVLAQQVSVAGETQEQQRARLQSELNALEAEIAEKQALLDKQKGQTGSLSHDVSLLQTEINKAKLNIKAKAIVISQLSNQISQKSSKINLLSDKITKEKDSLAQLLRKTDEIDSANMVNLVLSEQSVSDFYKDIDSFGSIKSSVRSSVLQINDAKVQTESEKKSLEISQNAALDAKMALESSKQKVEDSKQQVAQLLSISKDKEQQYAAILKERQAKAASIRATLFSLRDTGAIPFGKAYDYAVQVSKATGVRPAFLLAALTQESNLGQNVGTCYLSDTTSGSGASINSGKTFSNVMHPTRDIPPFLLITGALGMDPLKTRVSCPIPSAGGYGGAMGPAQFIPSTWKMYENRLKSALGVATPDPWSNRDAFMAAGLFLSDLGAGTGSYSDERNAACRYYGGRKCSASNIVAGYGDQVMAKATTIQQTMIDPLQGL